MNEWDTVIATIKHHKSGMLIGLISGLVLATLIMLFQRPVWQAEMIIAPTGSTIPSLNNFLPKGAADAPAIQNFVSQIDSNQSSQFTEFTTLIRSPALFKKLRDSLPNLFSDKPLNETQMWLDKTLKIRPVGLTPYKRLILRSNDAGQAEAILKNLFILTDNQMRTARTETTTQRIDYLKTQLEKVRNPAHRSAIIAILKEQEHSAMMIAIDDSFAAKAIQPAYILPEPVAPRAILLFPILGFAGIILGFMLSGFIKAVKQA
jgi:hypothetical protein